MLPVTHACNAHSYSALCTSRSMPANTSLAVAVEGDGRDNSWLRSEAATVSLCFAASCNRETSSILLQTHGLRNGLKILLGSAMERTRCPSLTPGRSFGTEASPAMLVETVTASAWPFALLVRIEIVVSTIFPEVSAWLGFELPDRRNISMSKEK